MVENGVCQSGSSPIMAATGHPLAWPTASYAARLQEANVPTDLQRYAGQMHGFFTLLMLPGSEFGFQQVVKAVKACIVKARKAQPVQ